MNSTDVRHIAVLSDIHGNRWALEKVLEDIERRGVRNIINLGDSLYGPLDPAGTAGILMSLDWPTVRGNEDRLVTDSGPESDIPTIRFVHGQLGPVHVEWLKNLPVNAEVFDDLFLCHGTPERDDEYLLQVVESQGCQPRTPAELAKKLRAVEAKVVCCGHDHVPAFVRLPEGRVVINPGSVGLQAYEDDSPVLHSMQTASPHARYSVLTTTGDGWQAEDISVPYDWYQAAATAERNGRADWAAWLLTGRAGTSETK